MTGVLSLLAYQSCLQPASLMMNCFDKWHQSSKAATMDDPNSMCSAQYDAKDKGKEGQGTTRHLGREGRDQSCSMSIIGETCSAFGTREPAGSNANATRWPHGVLVTSARQRASVPLAE
jgi:hypothetical protein